MSDTPLHSGWNSVEDERPVAVRTSSTPEPNKRVPIAPSESSTKLAAATGIGSVLLLFAVFYFGFGMNLQGEVSPSAEKTVTITKAGVFDPVAVDVQTSETLSFKNEHTDPVVLKSKDATKGELFPVQVIFPGESFSVNIATSAAGKTYVYYSETLANTEVTIRVTEATSSASVQTESASSSQAGIEIPLPLGQDESVVVPATSSTSSMSSSVASVSSASSASTEANPVLLRAASSSSDASSGRLPTNVPSILTVRQQSATSSSASSLDGMGGNDLPTNPYTVANIAAMQKRGVSTTENKAKNKKQPAINSASGLHSGAPLLTTVQRPRTNTETGPESWIVVLLVAGFSVWMLERRLSKVRS